jgi:drug/metabolite transporter (DMT)-like permease
VLLFVIPALWSSNYLIARLSPGVIGPHTLAFGRWAVAGLILLPFVWAGLRRDPTVWRREGRQLLVLGGLGMGICGAWVYIAGRTTTSTNIALIYAVTPVTIAMASAWLLHERMRAAQRLGVAAAFGGLLFVIAKGDLAHLLDVRFAPGDLWIVACAAAWTAYSVLLRRWPSTLGTAERLVAIIAGGLVVLAPFTLAEWWIEPQPPLGARAIGLVLIGALVPGVISYGAHAWLQQQIGASRTALMLYLSPIFGALGAWAVLGEVPQWYHGAGAALILPSIWLATRGGAAAQPKSPGASAGPSSSSA